MSKHQAIIDALPQLQGFSGKRLPDSIIAGFLVQLSHPWQLMRNVSVSPRPIYEPRLGIGHLSSHQDLQRARRLRSLQAGADGNSTYRLNTELLGGSDYPVLSAVLGTISGFASAGAGLLFTVMTTSLSLARNSQRILAREGDELWQVEAIGKARSRTVVGPTANVAVHIGSFFLFDPHRSSVSEGQVPKGWLIHEQRQELTLR